MSIGFHEIEDSVVVLRNKGVYKQTKAYARKGRVYAANAGGYVLLRDKGRTSHPNIGWEDIELGFAPAFDTLGRMLTGESR